LDIGRKAADRHRELWRATSGVGDGTTQRAVDKPIVHAAPVGARGQVERGCRAGSHGYATIYEIKDELYKLRPEPDAVKGSDYRILRSGRVYWAPRRGVPIQQLDTAPQFWYKKF